MGWKFKAVKPQTAEKWLVEKPEQQSLRNQNTLAYLVVNVEMLFRDS